MKLICGLFVLCVSLGASAVLAQVSQVEPRVLTKAEIEGKVTVVEIAARFVTTIRLPDAVNSVVIGDPSEFQVEHSDREPKLVFVKAVSKKPSETNLLISTAAGHQVSVLLVSRGDISPNLGTIDFLVKYEYPKGFFVGPSAFPFALIGATIPLTQTAEIAEGTQAISKPVARPVALTHAPGDPPSTFNYQSQDDVQNPSLDKLLEQQEAASLPAMYGEHVTEESRSGDRIRAGVSRVIDGGQEVIVLFSVVNPTKYAILLMPPQVQLGGRTTSGKVVRHKKWATAKQLPVQDFRLNRRRLGRGERADGVVAFVRPPYKQSNETLLLQVAESGAVDRPALAPISFGVSRSREEHNDGRK